MKQFLSIAALILLVTGVAVAQQPQTQSPPPPQHQHSMQGDGMCLMMSGGKMGGGKAAALPPFNRRLQRGDTIR